MDDILMQAMAEETEQSTDEVLMSAISKVDEYDDILMHYGVDGMHWYERRYQNPDGSLTPLGRIHYGIGKARAKRAEKKIRKAEKAEADRVKKVERLARSGDVDKIYKNRKLFTKDELYDAISRAEKLSAFQKTGRKAQAEARQQAKPVDSKAMAKSKITLDGIAKTAKTLAGLYSSYKVIALAVNAATGKETLPDFDKGPISGWKERRAKSGKGSEKTSEGTEQTTAPQTKKEQDTKKADTKSSAFTNQKTEPSPKWKKVADDDRGAFTNAGRRANEPFVNTYAWEKVSDNDRGYSFSKPKMSDDVINTVFDAVTGSYGVPKTDWASAMMTPISSIPSPDYSPRRWK